MEEEEERNPSPGSAGGRGRVEGNFVWRPAAGRGGGGCRPPCAGGTGRDVAGMVEEGGMRGGVRTGARTEETYRLFPPRTSAAAAAGRAGVPGGQVSLAVVLRRPRPGWGSRGSLFSVDEASPGGRQVIRCNSRPVRRHFASLREFTGAPPASPSPS